MALSGSIAFAMGMLGYFLGKGFGRINKFFISIIKTLKAKIIDLKQEMDQEMENIS